MSARDYRVDFWRGAALLTIFVNHIPGNAFERLTSRNFGFSDAAELFVLLAGFAAAFAYFRRFEAGEAVLSAVKVWWRAAQLYVAHVFTAVLALALFASAYLASGELRFLENHGVGRIFTDPVAGMVGLVTLGHQIGYFNILPLYVALLVAAPAIMLLARHSLGLALGVSAAIWLVVQATGLTLPNWPAPGSWFFNPFAWQFLFTIGIVCGILVARGEGLAYNRHLYWAAAGYLLFALGWRLADVSFDPEAVPLPEIVTSFNKNDLALSRLLHVLALAYVFAFSPLARWMREVVGPRNPLVLIGRHSLIIFCFGSLLSALGQVLRHVFDRALEVDVVVVTAGILLHLVLAGGLEWYRVNVQRPSSARPAVASVGSPGKSATRPRPA